MITLPNGLSDLHRKNARYIKKIIKRDNIDIYYYDSYDDIRNYIYTLLGSQRQIKIILKEFTKENEDYSNRALEMMNYYQEKLVRDFYDKYVVDTDITRLRLMKLKYDY